MFVFEDVITLDDVSIQRVLREVESKDLALALKGVQKRLPMLFSEINPRELLLH
jgi:flagellar motor switch protein FliG